MEKIPEGTKQVSDNKTSLINKLKRKAYPVVSRYWIRATLVEGKLKNTNEIFRCMFVENNSLMLYMLPRMYGEAPVILKKWRIWTPLLKKVLNTCSKSIDMAVGGYFLQSIMVNSRNRRTSKAKCSSAHLSIHQMAGKESGSGFTLVKGNFPIGWIRIPTFHAGFQTI